MKQRRMYILFSTIFFILGVIFFSLAIRQYQVTTSTQAAESLDVTISNDTYGAVNQTLGFILPDITDTALVNEIDSKFKVANASTGTRNIYIKLINPTVTTIQHSNFQKLEDSHFRWYFSFSSMDNAEAALAAYYGTYQNETVLEITNYDQVDKNRVAQIHANYPKVKFHAAEFTFWPRETVKELLEQMQPPQINAVSIKTIVDDPSESVKDDVLLMFDTFWDASRDVGGNSGIEINYPPNTQLALSDIRTNQNGDAMAEQARRLGIVTSAIVSALPSQGSDKAPIRFIIAGDIKKMSALEQNTLLGYAHFIQQQPEVLWPEATSANGSVMRGVEPIVGTFAKKGTEYYGLFTNTIDEPIEIKLNKDLSLGTYKTFSDQRGAGDLLNDNNTILLNGYETVYVFASTTWPGLLQAGDVPTPTTPAGGATPFPTLPDIPQTAGQLVCDAGVDAYNSDTIQITNNSDKKIDEINAVVFRCTYIPDKIRKGFYKCETCTDSDEVNNPDCQVGTFDPDASQDFSLEPGETKTISVPANPCEIIQLDVANNEPHVDDSPYECFNPRSQYTNPAPPARWQGGIAFAISENSEGYDPATQTCPQPPTATPTPTVPQDTPTVTPTANPSDSPTPTPSPSDTPTPSPTNSPTPSPTKTPTPSPTPTPIPPTPTFTPVPPPPTATPVQNLTVNEQAPGMNPVFAILIPFALVLLGLAL